mmetsp:Transcript_13130/g.21771  ORF Transcript_13130/g.21771 Transcript_13130/m.21771 type:complete len:453 (-) Transcript_13130:2339-3697(-)
MFAKTLLTRPVLFAMSLSSSAYIETKVGAEGAKKMLLETAVMAKPCAWISVDNHKVALLDGYNIANMSPPTLMMASDAIPKTMLDQLSSAGSNQKVTLSCATVRDEHCLDRAKNILTFAEMGLLPATSRQHSEGGYPKAVQSSPIHMYCRLVDQVDLGRVDGKTMVLLCIDEVVMKREILTTPPPAENSGRSILALVDAAKMQPLAAMGNGKYATMSGVHLLLRPSQTTEEKTGWKSDPIVLKKTNDDGIISSKIPETVEWITSEPSPLGFNPLKAIVIPRPIGWISTYHPSTVPHIAPYSFFMDVARGDTPMVAFSAFRPIDGPLKDAQLDVEETKCFGVSTVTEDLVEAMNLSSAPIERNESEFELGGIVAEPATHVAAPLVQGSKVQLECEYVKTVDAGGFSVIIGKVVSSKVSKSVLTSDGTRVDGNKLKPITRLGYIDEYAVIDQSV